MYGIRANLPATLHPKWKLSTQKRNIQNGQQFAIDYWLLTDVAVLRQTKLENKNWIINKWIWGYTDTLCISCAGFCYLFIHLKSQASLKANRQPRECFVLLSLWKIQHFRFYSSSLLLHIRLFKQLWASMIIVFINNNQLTRHSHLCMNRKVDQNSQIKLRINGIMFIWVLANQNLNPFLVNCLYLYLALAYRV